MLVVHSAGDSYCTSVFNSKVDQDGKFQNQHTLQVPLPCRYDSSKSGDPSASTGVGRCPYPV